MNARKKAKHYKKQLAALYEDYVTSAMMTEEVLKVVAGNIEKMREQQVSCVYQKTYDSPVVIDEDIAIEFWEQLTYSMAFREAVQFYGHTDPETGKYILEAKLTVVMPDVETEE